MWRRITTHSLPLTLLVGVLVGVGFLVSTAAGDRRGVAHTTGVLIVSPVAKIAPGDTACQRPVILDQASDGIIFNPGAENDELFEMAQQRGIKPMEACTLVLLSTGQY